MKLSAVSPDLSRLTCPCPPVQAILSRLPCPECPFTIVLLLSWVSCPGFDVPVTLVLTWFSCPAYLGCFVRGSCPVPAVLPRLFSPSCPVYVVMSWPSFPLFPVLDVPSRPCSPAFLSWLPCPGSPVFLSCTCCHALTILSYLYYPGRPVIERPCPDCLVLCRGPVLKVLSQLSLHGFLECKLTSYLTFCHSFTFSKVNGLSFFKANVENFTLLKLTVSAVSKATVTLSKVNAFILE